MTAIYVIYAVLGVLVLTSVGIIVWNGYGFDDHDDGLDVLDDRSDADRDPAAWLDTLRNGGGGGHVS